MHAMPSYQIINCDVIEVLRQLESNSIHCCITSPPYYGLRDYGTEGQIGLEPTPEEFIDKLISVFHEVYRVLRPDGTLWVNMGDSYFGSWGNYGGKNRGKGSQREIGNGSSVPNPAYDGLEAFRPPQTAKHSKYKPKDRMFIPHRLALALLDDGWYARDEIVWAKPSPMPESVTDRCTKAHEFVFMFSKQERYFYDKEAIQETSVSKEMRKGFRGGDGTRYTNNRSFDNSAESINGSGSLPQPNKRNKRSVWHVVSQGYPEAHFATFSPKLIEPMILAGTSTKGCCPECGSPAKRILNKTRKATRPGEKTKIKVPSGWDTSKGSHGTIHKDGRTKEPEYREVEEVGNRDPKRHCTITDTIGWEPTCKCGKELYQFLPCTVLDPFAGSGTTLAVSLQHGRNAIGIEINPEYCNLIRKRIADTMGMFA